MLHDITHQSGSSQSTKDALFTHIMSRVHMIKHSRQHTTSTASWSCHDGTTRSVFFTYSQSIGINQSSALQRGTIAPCLDKISSSLALKLERTRQYAFMIQSITDGLFHCLPDSTEEIPNITTLTLFYILPE